MATTHLRDPIFYMTGKPGKTRMDAIKRLHSGLELSAFDNIRKYLNVSTSELARVTRITERTLARRKQKKEKFTPEESDRIYRVALILNKTVDLFDSEEEATRWLKTPRPALDGNTPLDLLDTEPGLREVEDLLGRIEHGVF